MPELETRYKTRIYWSKTTSIHTCNKGFVGPAHWLHQFLVSYNIGIYKSLTLKNLVSSLRRDNHLEGGDEGYNYFMVTKPCEQNSLKIFDPNLCFLPMIATYQSSFKHGWYSCRSRLSAHFSKQLCPKAKTSAITYNRNMGFPSQKGHMGQLWVGFNLKSNTESSDVTLKLLAYTHS